MTLNFPSSPNTGDTYTLDDVTYEYTGTKWKQSTKYYNYSGSVLNSANNITAFNLSLGNYFELDLQDDTEIVFANPPSSDFTQKFYLKLSVGSEYVYDTFQLGYGLENASYDNVSFSVAALEAGPTGLFFKPDGTKMYVVGFTGDAVNEYDLSTAWDVTSASYLQNFSVAAQDSVPFAIFFKPDGTKMYVLGTTGDDVNEYDLSTAWDVTSASYLQNFSVAAQDDVLSGLFFKPDGTKMYVIGLTDDDVNEYDLSTAWDISTASYVQNFGVNAQETAPSAIFFKPDGTKMYVVGNAGDDVNEYDLSTDWDISSASYVQNFSVGVQDTRPGGLFFKPDGAKMYVLGRNTNSVYQYSTLSDDLGNVPITTWPTNLEWETGAAPDTPEPSETDIYEIYTSDGGVAYYAKLLQGDIG